MSDLHVLRVFTDANGAYGNPLGVVLDGSSVEPDARQALARRLGFSETVFVDDASTGTVCIFTPGRELPFAGHPLVGTGWLLASQGADLAALHPPAGEVATWSEGELRWIRGRADWVHDMHVVQLDSPAAIEALVAAPGDESNTYVWAWDDESSGAVRSRYFAGTLGIVEDEATGAAAVVLTTRLGRPLEIRQGRGSRLSARPGPDGTAEVGGRVVLDEVRPL
ncbi:MAG: PhzF family phenazine biosynthesis protein [Chloroflexota bacterium]